MCWRTDLGLSILYRGLRYAIRSLELSFLNSSTNGDSGGNRLLATLPKNEYKRLLPMLKTVNLVLGEVLYEPGEAIKYVIFLTTRSSH